MGRGTTVTTIHNLGAIRENDSKGHGMDKLPLKRSGATVIVAT